MGGGKKRYEGNRQIEEDEASYTDYRTVQFINLVVDLVVGITLAKMEPQEPTTTPQWILEAQKQRKRTKRKPRNNPRT
jgi:hypothetical protein